MSELANTTIAMGVDYRQFIEELKSRVTVGTSRRPGP